MFVDVDYSRPAPASAAATLRSFGTVARKGIARTTDNAMSRLLERFDEVGRSQPALGFRVYRTAGGFRLLVTSDTYDPKSDAADRAAQRFRQRSAVHATLQSPGMFSRSAVGQVLAVRRTAGRRRVSLGPTTEHEDAIPAVGGRLSPPRQPIRHLPIVGTSASPANREAARPILETHDRLTMQDGAKLA